MKHETEINIGEVGSIKEHYLSLSYNRFLYYQGEIYSEDLKTFKSYHFDILPFLYLVEPISRLDENFLVSARLKNEWRSLVNCDLCIGGITFDGIHEVQEFLKWTYKVLDL